MADLFHGGLAGLRPGDLLLPPSVTGVPRGPLWEGRTIDGYRPDRVYLSTSRPIAEMFAAFHPRGAAGRYGDVYLAEPIGDLEPDASSAGSGISWQAPQARIVAIVATGIRREPYSQAILAEARDRLLSKDPPRLTRYPAPHPISTPRGWKRR